MTFDVGERLRELRNSAGLTQRQLAEQAGVPHGQISMIEKNRSSPSISSLRKILGGLSMTLGEFFEPERPQNGKVFFTPSDLLDLTGRLHSVQNGSTDGRISLRQVGDARAHNLQMLHERYEPGADTGEVLLEHLSHEAGIVISGEIEITVGEQIRVLKAGDAYLFDSRQPHRFRNTGDRPCEVVSACSPPYL